MPHKLLSSLAIVGVLFSLAACSASPSTATADCTPAASGASSDKVKATGDVGTAPTVTFDTPLTATTTERTVLEDGKGTVAVEGSVVTVQYSAYNATSGDQIDATSYEEDGTANFTLDSTQLLPGLLSALECSKPGDRVAAVIPPDDAFGETGSTDLGIAATDSLVFVIDVVDVAKPVTALDKADGVAQEPVAGLPTVVLADDGSPTITVPATDPPTELQIADLKLGDGTEVQDGDTVTVHYTGVIWATGAVFDSSWTTGEPATFATTGVISGFSKALVGQKVGSQVIAVIPPSEGYGDAGSGTLISGTDTLVFVIDILATQ